MIDEKFMNQIIETLNMRAVEEIEQYAGQAIDTVDSGIFLALERWLRLKEDFLNNICYRVIGPAQETQTMEYHPNPKDGAVNIENANEDPIVKLVGFGLAKENTEEDVAREFERCLRQMREREEWEAKQKEGLHVIDILLSHLKEVSHYDGMSIDCINRLRDLLANKDEVEK